MPELMKTAKSEDKDKGKGRISRVDSLPLMGTSVVNRWNISTDMPPWPMLKH
jgi:hypothetical protein